MADLEVNDLDFYQTDYTNASAWEAFNFNLEEVLSKLRQSDNVEKSESAIEVGKWSAKTEEISFQELAIVVTLYWRETEAGKDEGNFTYCDTVEKETEFPLPPLWKWYSLSSFILLSTKDNGIIPEHHLKTIQSSLTMAVAETNCSTPVFLRVLHRKANMFLGLSDDSHTRTHYDMIYLRALPANYKCFTGLHEIFKGKVGHLSADPIQVAVRICFSTNELKDFLELDKQPEPDELRYPFGIQTDPIKTVLLHCVWPELASSVVMHASFDATRATEWIVQCVWDENAIEILSDFVDEFTDELMNESVLIGANDHLSSSPLFAFPESSWSKLRGQDNSNNKSHDNAGTIPEDVVKKFLYYLFPDADDTDPRVYDVDKGKSPTTSNKMKTGVKDCLIHRLSLVLALSYANFDGEYGVKCFWNEFFNEIRYRVDHSIEIPGISAGFPDYHTCLLHQKLQMVNVCINRRQQRAEAAQNKRESPDKSGAAAENSDDEFYDCEEDESVLVKPCGRLSPLGDLNLVRHPEEVLYIPETQDAVVKTEDELESDADVILKLGPGSDLSSQMMSLSLQSDMESFKAANPRAGIEDFIRWYSPRDWIEGEAATSGQGAISDRMKIPGNTWQTVWAAAKPIPAKKQKCLFDDAKEVEKVMCYLEHLKVGDLVYLVLPCLMEDAIGTLTAELERYRELLAPDILSKRLPMLHELVCKYSRDFWSATQGNGNKSVAGPKWKYAVHEIRQLESLASRTKSLCEKLSVAVGEASDENGQLVRGLLSGRPTVVVGGPGNAKWKEILQLFSQTHEGEGGVASAETEREFVFRMEKKVGGGEVTLPQFMRVLLKPNSQEYRICGAFSQHVNIVYE